MPETLKWIVQIVTAIVTYGMVMNALYELYPFQIYTYKRSFCLGTALYSLVFGPIGLIMAGLVIGILSFDEKKNLFGFKFV